MEIPRRLRSQLPSYTVRGEVKVQVGDKVLIRHNDLISKIVRVEKIEHLPSEDNIVEFNARTYFTPDEVLGAERRFYGLKELFLTDIPDKFDGKKIVRKVNVHSLLDYLLLENVGLDDYYCHSEYFVLKQSFRPMEQVKVYCICRMPFNPDEPMWRCKACGESYHGPCVGKTVNEMRELQFICCSERMPTTDAMEKFNLSSATPEDSEEKPYSSSAAIPEDEDMEVKPISGNADDEENSEMKTNSSSAATHMVEEPISAYADDHEEDSEMQTDSSSAATSDVDEEDEDEDSKKKARIDLILGADPKAKAMEMKQSYTIPGTQIVVKAGDCVYVRTSENDYTPRVAYIEPLFEPNYDIVDDDKDFGRLLEHRTVCMSVYCKPEDTNFGRKSFHGVDELFELEKKENIKLHWILGICRVQMLEIYAKLTSDTTHEYYSRYTYNEQTQHLTVTPGLKEHGRCLCMMPYNPDMFMIQCIKCQQWFHPSCLHITVHHALELMGSFECPDDHPQSWKCNCNNRNPQSNMTECSQCNTFFHPACIGRTVEEMVELVLIPQCSYHAESERECFYCHVHCGEIEKCARCGAEFHRHCLRNESAKTGEVLDCPWGC